MTDSLSTQLDETLRAAGQWLETRSTPGEDAGEWYALNNFRVFIDAVQTDRSPEGIERACHVFGWHIVDQYDTDESWQAISGFNERIRRIGKDMAWEQSRHSPAVD